MHRFYIPAESWNPAALALTGAEAHHCRNVLRLKQGDEVVLFNGRGAELAAEIVSERAAEVHLRKLSETQTPPLPCQITLAQAIPKGKNMDLIVQKAVEIGAAEIAPLISERTIIHLDERETAEKQSKWQRVAIEAAKQCGQNWLPRVQPPKTPKDFFLNVEAGVSPAQNSGMQPSSASGGPLQKAGSELRLIGSLQSDAVHLKRVLVDYEREHGARPSAVLMCIGPEGDFTPAELNLARSHGCLPISLGPIILRVETAAIYCLSVLSYELLSEPKSR